MPQGVEVQVLSSAPVKKIRDFLLNFEGWHEVSVNGFSGGELFFGVHEHVFFVFRIRFNPLAEIPDRKSLFIISLSRPKRAILEPEWRF